MTKTRKETAAALCQFQRHFAQHPDCSMCFHCTAASAQFARANFHQENLTFIPKDGSWALNNMLEILVSHEVVGQLDMMVFEGPFQTILIPIPTLWSRLQREETNLTSAYKEGENLRCCSNREYFCRWRQSYTGCFGPWKQENMNRGTFKKLDGAAENLRESHHCNKLEFISD